MESTDLKVASTARKQYQCQVMVAAKIIASGEQYLDKPLNLAPAIATSDTASSALSSSGASLLRRSTTSTVGVISLIATPNAFPAQTEKR